MEDARDLVGAADVVGAARALGVDEAAGASEVGASVVVGAVAVVAAVVVGGSDVAGAEVPPPDEHAPRAIIAALTAATALRQPLRLFAESNYSTRGDQTRE